MSKTKKSPKVQYGIEITKPWSKEMYDHNDKVASEMKANLMHHWNLLVDRLLKNSDYYSLDTEWNERLINDDCPELVKLQRGVCYSGYGSGYTLEEVDREFRDEVENMPNYMLHESYSYLAFKGMLPRTSFMLVGFEWEKFDYHVIGSQELTSPAVVVNKVADRLMKDSIDA